MIILLPAKISALVELPRELRVQRLANFFENAWALAMNGQGRAAVGLYCERDWLPADKDCPMQNSAGALMAAGGLPVPIYLGGGEPRDQLCRVSGLLLPGGNPIEPDFDGVVPGSDTENDRFQNKCVQLASQMGLPILGVGRGAHILNLAQGGTLSPSQSRALGRVAEGFQVTALAPDGTIECIERKRPWAVGCELSQESYFLRLVRQAERVVLPLAGMRVRVKVSRSAKKRLKV